MAVNTRSPAWCVRGKTASPKNLRSGAKSKNATCIPSQPACLSPTNLSTSCSGLPMIWMLPPRVRCLSPCAFQATASPQLLAALAQVEGAGNPVATTYWRWRLTWNPFCDLPACLEQRRYVPDD